MSFYPRRTEGFAFRTSLLSIALLLSDVAAVSPTLPYLAKRFPEQSQALIQSFITAPAVAAFAAALLSGAIAPRVGKRRLVLIGIMCIILGGLSPFVLIPLGSYFLVLAFRLVAGFGMGLLQPLSASLIVDFFRGEDRARMLGFQSSMVGGGGMLWGIVVSLLMLGGWQQAYWVYAGGIIIFLAVFFFVPEPDRKVPQAGTTKPKITLPKGTIFTVLLMFLVTVSFQALGISLPFVAIDERHLVTGSEVSMIMTTFSLASVIAGVIFSLTIRAFRYWTPAVSIALLGAGLMLEYYAYGRFLLYAGAICVGIGFGTFMPYALNASNRRANSDSSAAVTAIVFVGAVVAGFTSPGWFAAGQAILRMSQPSAQFLVAAFTLVPTTIAAAIFYKLDDRWYREAQQ